MNTFFYRLDTGATITDGGLFLAQFNAALALPVALYEEYLQAIPAQCLNVEADLQWIDLDRFVKQTFTVGAAGEAAVGTTVTNLAAALELRGDKASKRAVGTKHIPGVSGGSVVAGVLGAALIGALQNLGGASLLPVTVATRIMTPIIFGRARPEYTDKHGVLHPALPKSYQVVTGFAVQPTARVMRRRTVGLGI